MRVLVPQPTAGCGTTRRAQQQQRFGSRGGSTGLVVRNSGSSKLDGVVMAPPDPILGISDAFKADPSDAKLNLGVGAYRTDELQPYVLEVVKKAERRMLDKNENKEYLAMDGLPAFKAATVELLLGADCTAVKEGRVGTIQALSGTGALRLGSEFMSKFMPSVAVYLPNPTWGNHKNIFADAGVEWREYRYFDPETVGLDFDGMIEDLANAPSGSAVILHGCAHNPTGIDPTPEQWAKVADLCQERGLMPFFDSAYQGFASGSLEKDAKAMRMFVDRGMELFIAQSYSKNLGLYAERIGALNVVLANKDAATKVLSQLKRIARAMYSNPPVHGARIVSEVVGDEALFGEWKQEMEMMAGRIMSVRKLLHDELVKLNPDKDWSFVLKQIGMFSYTGMSPAQVANMTDKHHIYMTKDGRISLAGLNSAKAPYLAAAMDDSVRNF